MNRRKLIFAYLRSKNPKKLYFFSRMLGGVGGRHVSTRRRGSSPLVRAGAGLGENHVFLPDGAPRYTRRRRAVTTSDHKSCALIQTRLKLGDIM